MLFSRTPKPASFANIRMQIISRWLLKKNQECSVIALTSRLPGEGVSTVTSGLARSFNSTDAGKVLLLNAGRKHPRKAVVLDVSDSQRNIGLSDYVTQCNKSGYDILRVANLANSNFFRRDHAEEFETPLPDIIIDEGKDEDEDEVLSGLAELDGSTQPPKLLPKLRKIYDLILIDAGSLGNPNGTFWLLNSDINILVLDCTRTTWESLEHQHREFENSDISIDGSILNKRKFQIPKSLYWLVG